MAYTEHDFMEGLEKVAEDAYNWRMQKVATGLSMEKIGGLIPAEAPLPKESPPKQEQGDIGKQAAALALELAKSAGIPANIAKSPETSAKEKAKILAVQQAMKQQKTAGVVDWIKDKLHYTKLPPEIAKLPPAEQAKWYKENVMDKKAGLDKTAQGYSPYGMAPGPLARGGGFQAPARPMPIEPEPSFAVQHPTAVTTGAAAAGGVAGGAGGYAVGKAVEALTGSSQAGAIGAAAGGTIGSILGAAIGSREAEKAEENYSRQLVDYLSKISMDKESAKIPQSLVTATKEIASGVRKRPPGIVSAAKQYMKENPKYFAQGGLPESLRKATEEIASGVRKRPPGVVDAAKKYMKENPQFFKTSADKSGERPKSYQMYYGPTPESVKRLQSHERTGKTVGTIGGILAGLPIAARAMKKTPKSALLALSMMGAPIAGGIAGRKGGEYIGKEIGEARTGAKTEKLPFISPGRTLAMAQVAGRKSTVPRELPPSSRFILQPTVAVKQR